MASLLSYGEQAFWVSNSTKDLLYDAAVEVARRSDPVAQGRLSEDSRLLGCYGVSGLGFPLEAFAEAFGGKPAWQEATVQNFGVVEALCTTPECVEVMTKLLAWAWFLLDGGRCNDAAGRHPDLHELPVMPSEQAAPRAVESPSRGPTAHVLERTASTKFKFAFGIGFGALVGTLVGIANIFLGLAQNWLTIGAWLFAGVLIGSAHPTVDAIFGRHQPPGRAARRVGQA
jgi:hypothetical protein